MSDEALFREAVATRITPADFFAALRTAWIEQFGTEPARVSLLTIMAQSALETGRWSKCMAWNFGNAKAPPGCGRKWTVYPCSEVDEHGVEHVYKPPDPVCRFRAFDSLDEGMRDYLDLLSVRFLPAWAAVQAGDPAAFVESLSAQHYFTASVVSYKAAIVSLFHEFDHTVPADPPPIHDLASAAIDEATSLVVHRDTDPAPPPDPEEPPASAA